MRIPIAVCVVFAMTGSTWAQTPVDFSGVWWNQRCSFMDVTVTGEELSGNYTSAVGASAGRPFPLTGFRAGVDLIAFAVNFGPTGSLATWAGQHTEERGTEQIVTMWHVTVDIPDDREEEDLWRSMDGV